MGRKSSGRMLGTKSAWRQNQIASNGAQSKNVVSTFMQSLLRLKKKNGNGNTISGSQIPATHITPSKIFAEQHAMKPARFNIIAQKYNRLVEAGLRGSVENIAQKLVEKSNPKESIPFTYADAYKVALWAHGKKMVELIKLE